MGPPADLGRRGTGLPALAGRVAQPTRRLGDGRHPGYLLAGAPLAEAESRLAVYPEGLSQADGAYIRESRGHAERGRRRGRVAVAVVILGLAAVAGVAGWQWQRAAAETALNSAEDLVNFMTFDLREKLQPIGRLELLRDTQARIDRYYAQQGAPSGDLVSMRRRAVNLVHSGELASALGDLSGAARLYVDAAEVFKGLAESDPSNAGWQRDLSVSLNKIGDLKTAQGDLAGALAAYSESQAIAERLAGSDPSNVQWQLDVVFSLWKLTGPGLAAPDVARDLLRGSTILEGLEEAGRLPGSQGNWPGLLRERLQTLGDGAD